MREEADARGTEALNEVVALDETVESGVHAPMVLRHCDGSRSRRSSGAVGSGSGEEEEEEEEEADADGGAAVDAGGATDDGEGEGADADVAAGAVPAADAEGFARGSGVRAEAAGTGNGRTAPLVAGAAGASAGLVESDGEGGPPERAPEAEGAGVSEASAPDPDGDVPLAVALGVALALWLKVGVALGVDVATDGEVADAAEPLVVVVGRGSSWVRSANIATSVASPTPPAIHVIVRRSVAGDESVEESVEESVDESEVATRPEGVLGAPERSSTDDDDGIASISAVDSGISSSASPETARANAMPAARAFWNRSLGARAQTCANHASSAGGSSGTTSVMRGLVVWMARVIAPTVTPSNGRFPVSASNARTPSDQMSARASTSSPRICSGLM